MSVLFRNIALSFLAHRSRSLNLAMGHFLFAILSG